MCPEVVDVSVDDDDDETRKELENKVSELAQLLYGLPKNLKVKLELEPPATHQVSVSKNVPQVCDRLFTVLLDPRTGQPCQTRQTNQ